MGGCARRADFRVRITASLYDFSDKRVHRRRHRVRPGKLPHGTAALGEPAQHKLVAVKEDYVRAFRIDASG